MGVCIVHLIGRIAFQLDMCNYKAGYLHKYKKNDNLDKLVGQGQLRYTQHALVRSKMERPRYVCISHQFHHKKYLLDKQSCTVPGQKIRRYHMKDIHDKSTVQVELYCSLSLKID